MNERVPIALELNTYFFPFQGLTEPNEVDLGRVASLQAQGGFYPCDYSIYEVPVVLNGIHGSIQVVPEVISHSPLLANRLFPMGDVRLEATTSAATRSQTLVEAPVCIMTDFGIADPAQYEELCRFAIEFELGSRRFTYDLLYDLDPESAQEEFDAGTTDLRVTSPAPVEIDGETRSDFIVPLIPGRLDVLRGIRARLIEKAVTTTLD